MVCLGSFYEVFSQTNTLKCTDIDVNENWIEYIDFRNTEEYFKDVANFQPDVLFHIGALTSLEYCEENPKNAYLTNTLVTETATHISNELKYQYFIYQLQVYLMVSRISMMIGMNQIHWGFMQDLSIWEKNMFL